MTNDSHIPWVRKRKFYQLNELFVLEEPASGIQQAALETDIKLKEVAATGTVGFVMVDGDIVLPKIYCPADLDPLREVGFRVVYTLDHDGTGDANTNWTILCDAITAGVAIGAAATTALNTIIPQHEYVDSDGVASVTDDLLQITARGIKNDIGLTRAQIENLALIKLSVTMVDAAEETDVIFLGILMDYAPRKTVGMGSNRDAPLNSSSSL